MNLDIFNKRLASADVDASVKLAYRRLTLLKGQIGKCFLLLSDSIDLNDAKLYIL